ncbi:hypothetical protein, partial [Pseudomonas rossensis]|uniref:hypothetical protein n=1 Tax=Pseudomonas rossensis TaxID=2305471 RepID=UPI0032619C28
LYTYKIYKYILMIFCGITASLYNNSIASRTVAYATVCHATVIQQTALLIEQPLRFNTLKAP